MAQEALALRDVEEPLPEPAQAACALVECDAVAADAPLHARRPVVAQVFADAGQLVHHRDAERLEAFRLSDAGKLEQLRRGDRAGRDDDLTRGARLQGLALHGVAYADAARAFEQQRLCMRAGLDAEIAPRARRIEIDLRG